MTLTFEDDLVLNPSISVRSTFIAPRASQRALCLLLMNALLRLSAQRLQSRAIAEASSWDRLEEEAERWDGLS